MGKMAWADEGGNEERKEMWEVAAGLGWAERCEGQPSQFFQHFFPFHVSVMDRELAKPTFPAFLSFPRFRQQQEEENAGKYCFFGN